MVLCERTKIKQRGKVVGSTNIQHEFGGGENPTLKQKTEQERNKGKMNNYLLHAYITTHLKHYKVI